MEIIIENKSQKQVTELRFKRLEDDNLEVILKYLKEFPTRSCDYSAGGILIWRDYFDYRYCIHNRTLFLMGRDEEGCFFHKPLGLMPYHESKELIKQYCDAEGINMRIIVPNEIVASEIDNFNGQHASKLDGWMEYVYSIEQFLHFSGKKMEKKRNHLHYFLNNYDGFTVEPIENAPINELVEFTDKFNLYHKDDATFDYESNATADTLKDYALYPYLGILIRYQSEIIGYTFGEAIGDTFFIHAEKGNIEFRGIYQALSSFLAAKILEAYPDVRYLNREDDMGNDYLRQSKMSYHPIKFIAKYVESE